ncbi:hypothetical protein LTR94_016895 [Friedmanniomyces endolithicus]|nr:hypothetical protein LTR94_016895 [Friedmanniomyces endolithicus]
MDTVFSETFVAPPRNVRPGECVVDAALNLIGGKWKGVIVYHLLDGPLRFSQLRELEAAGLVHRTVYAQVPPRVDYRLTGAGRTLSPVILALRAWGEAHLRMEVET